MESISILLPVFKPNIGWLKEQLESIAAQTFRNFRCVVSHDGPIPSSISDQIYSVFPDSRFKLVLNSNHLGTYRHIDYLISEFGLKSMFFALCDQDDVWLPQKLKQVSAVLVTKGYDLVMHSAKVVDRSLNWLGLNFPDIDSSRPMGFDEKRVGCFWPGFTLTVSQSLLKALESEMGQTPSSYDEKFAHDESICELAYVQRSIYMISEPLALYRQHGNNLIGFHGAINARTDMPRSCP